MARRTQKFIAYYRVSTARQGRSGLGLAAQRESVLAYIASVGGKLAAEITEVETGTNKHERPQLAAALQACRVHNALLVIGKLDRLSRNLNFISNLMESGCEFVACDLPAANRLTLHLLASIAEHEAEMISTRTKAALAAAKRKGTVLGGDRGNCQQIYRKGAKASALVRGEAAQRRAADLQPVLDDLRRQGAVSLRDLARGLNERQIPTARGGEWSAVQVARVMA
jgi:DNA invertase Pin-like site-specific DNA recombinase